MAALCSTRSPRTPWPTGYAKTRPRTGAAQPGWLTPVTGDFRPIPLSGRWRPGSDLVSVWLTVARLRGLMPDRSTRYGDSPNQVPDQVPATDWASRRRKRLRQTLIAIGAALVLVATVMGVGGAFLIQRYDRAVGRDDLIAPNARSARGGVTGPLNLLLIGSTGATAIRDAGDTIRTIIVAHLPKAMDKAYLVSVPRDLLVDILGHALGELHRRPRQDRCRVRVRPGGVGGTRLVSATLSQLRASSSTARAVIDFAGLKSAVDILGGVDMCVDTRVVSIHTGAVFEPGCRRTTSAETLDYLRQRDFPDGDDARQRPSAQFLKAFLDRARDTGATSNPAQDGRVGAGGGEHDDGEHRSGGPVTWCWPCALQPQGPGRCQDPVGSGVVIDDVSYVVTGPEVRPACSKLAR